MQSADSLKFTIGLKKTNFNVIHGGRMSRSGIENGSLIFLMTGRSGYFFDSVADEKHIVDVYSELKDVAIEFQSYQLKLDELVSRENFYKNLIWVVHGKKNDSDKIHFINGLRPTATSDRSLYHIIWYGRSKLLERWAGSKKKVYIDFGEEIVWLLLEFNPASKEGLVRSYMKNKFIKFFGGEEPVTKGD